ncbi:hypothetical protein N9R54_03680 [Pelobium sp.]|nr:hypothetical protein [Pelobium sp.]MDA9555314.1 hypothetical protein [Pelobium sp.]
MKIAYITYQNIGKYTSSIEDEDSILLNFLIKKGLLITEEIWDDETVNWTEYSHAILKSPWDYFDKFPAFIKWLNKIEQLNIKLLNPYHIIKWNSDKHYLQDIAKAGLDVVPTQFCEKNTLPSLSPYFDFFKTDELVIKPSVSGGSKNTFRFNPNNVSQIEASIHQLLKEEAFMIQPFLPEIAKYGEWSFVFFNGKYSHCLLKKAKSGDFRVQHYLGGTIHPQQPTNQQIQIAKAYVQQFAKGCLYARIDGVEVGDKFLLMELELIEPFLFLFTHPEAKEHYYEALTAMLP